ncbi:putative reverse transcriptase domain-containing protein [Tanacetum coccineum]
MVVATKPKTMQKVMQISGALTNEAVRNGSIKKVKKRGNMGEPSNDKNGRENGVLGVPLATPTMLMEHATNVGRRNQGNQSRGKAFMLGAEEARQDPNIVTGTFTLNNHFATTLFDSGVDNSFVSTTFIPLLGIKPSELGFRYEIEIASGQLVEIDKVIKGCKLEIEGHVFNIDLIPFGHGSFDVIIGIDWLSNHKAKIVCHEKVVRIPLLDSKVLRVLGERPEEKERLLMSVKASDKRQKEIVVIELIPGAVSIAKSPYRLAPTELEELSGQLKELQDKEVQFLGHVINGNGIHIDPRKIEAIKNWKAPRTPSEKCKTFDWGEEQENAFQTLKDKLYNALVLALPDGLEDFMVYCDASSLRLGCVLMQRGKRRWIELFSNYDCEIRYHLGKANVVVDALSRKKIVKPKRVRAMNMTLQSSIKDRILTAQKEVVDESTGLQRVFVCLKVTAEHSKAIWLAPQPEIPVWEMEGSWDVHLPLVEFSYNNSYHSSVRCALFVTLYGRKCRSPIMWAEVGEGQLIGPELVQETTEKISQIKDRLKAARDCWYALEEETSTRFVGPFEIIEKMPLDEIQVDAKLNFVEEPVEILEREFMKLKRSRIAIVKILYCVDGGDFVENCANL